MALKLLQPVGGGLLAPPTRPHGLPGAAGRFAEAWRFGLALRGQWSAAAAGDAMVFQRGFTRFGERDPTDSAEADTAAPAVNCQPLDPLFRPAGSDSQKQRVAVSVEARFVDCADYFDR